MQCGCLSVENTHGSLLVFIPPTGSYDPFWINSSGFSMTLCERNACRIPVLMPETDSARRGYPLDDLWTTVLTSVLDSMPDSVGVSRRSGHPESSASQRGRANWRGSPPLWRPLFASCVPRTAGALRGTTGGHMHPLHLAGHRSLRRLRPPTPAPPPLYRASTPPLHACRALRCRVTESVDSLPSFFPLWPLGTRPAPTAPMAPDPRLVIGATVHAKAKHVRSPVECAKVHASLSNVKMLNRTVTAVERVMTNKRHSTWLTARFELPNKVYVKRLGWLNFRAGPAPDPAPPPPPPPPPPTPRPHLLPFRQLLPARRPHHLFPCLDQWDRLGALPPKVPTRARRQPLWGSWHRPQPYPLSSPVFPLSSRRLRSGKQRRVPPWLHR